MGAIGPVLGCLLIIAGLAKWRAPTDRQPSIGASPFSQQATTRLVAIGEVTLGAMVVLFAGKLLTALLGGAFLGFAAVAFHKRRAGENCGCFGVSDAPTTWLHVVFDVMAGSAALLGTVVDPRPMHEVLEGPGELLLGAVLVVTAAWLCRLLLTALPDLEAVRRPLHEEAS